MNKEIRKYQVKLIEKLEAEWDMVILTPRSMKSWNVPGKGGSMKWKSHGLKVKDENRK
jgi:hypothetical protein